MVKQVVHTYEKSVRKRAVQAKQIEHLNGFQGDSLVLLGPNYQEYLTQIIDSISPDLYRVYSHENVFDVYLEQVSGLYPKYKDKVYTIFNGLTDAETKPYMDIDLLRTISTEYDLLYTLFKRQQQSYPDQQKVFCFTLCARDVSVKKKNIFEFLSNILNQKIELLEKFNCDFGIRYALTSTDPINITMYSYMDKGGPPMFNIQIQYI